MNTAYTPGPGDEATWGPGLGHGLDPRTPDDEDERRTAINEAILTLRRAESALDQLDAEDDKLFLRVDKLMADAAEYLIDAMDNARTQEIERLTAEVAALRGRVGVAA